MNTQYQLCFYSGSLTGKVFPITKEETKIGRDPSCDIILTENSVSRIHVFLYVQQNGAVVLVDNNSTNGTVVNSYQISAPVQLSENDVIGLGGEVMLVFQKAAGFDSGSQWIRTDMPAGNAPDSYNFEKKQGNPMNNENGYNNNDSAMNGFAPTNGQDQQQPASENYGFNQAYNMNYGTPAPNPGQQMPYGFNPMNQFGQSDASGFMNSMNPNPMQNAPVPADNAVSAFPASGDAPVSGTSAPDAGAEQAAPVSGFDSASQQQMPGQQPQMPYNANPYSQQPFGQPQNPYGFNPYGQPMNQQAPFGADPASAQQMGQSQAPFGSDPISQQQMPGQQMPFGNPYGQQAMMGQQMPFGSNPYGQQPQMGQQMPYGNDPFGQPQMGQQMPYGNDPYAQQMGQQMPYGNDPYAQQMGQQMPYGNDPFAQQMGQQMPFGIDPYAQQMGQQPMGQQMPFGNDPYAQQMGQQPMGQQMPFGNNPYGQQPMGQQMPPYGNAPYSQQYPETQLETPEVPEKKSKKKLFIILAIVLFVVILIAAFIFYVDHNRLWCDVFPFLWDADTCANYVK